MDNKEISIHGFKEKLIEYFMQDKQLSERDVDIKVEEFATQIAKSNKDKNPLFYSEVLDFITLRNLSIKEIMTKDGKPQINIDKIALQANAKYKNRMDNASKNNKSDLNKIFEDNTEKSKMSFAEAKAYFSSIDYNKPLTAEQYRKISDNYEIWAKTTSKEDKDKVLGEPYEELFGKNKNANTDQMIMLKESTTLKVCAFIKRLQAEGIEIDTNKVKEIITHYNLNNLTGKSEEELIQAVMNISKKLKQKEDMQIKKDNPKEDIQIKKDNPKENIVSKKESIGMQIVPDEVSDEIDSLFDAYAFDFADGETLDMESPTMQVEEEIKNDQLETVDQEQETLEQEQYKEETTFEVKEGFFSSLVSKMKSILPKRIQNRLSSKDRVKALSSGDGAVKSASEPDEVRRENGIVIETWHAEGNLEPLSKRIQNRFIQVGEFLAKGLQIFSNDKGNEVINHAFIVRESEEQEAKDRENSIDQLIVRKPEENVYGVTKNPKKTISKGIER